MNNTDFLLFVCIVAYGCMSAWVNMHSYGKISKYASACGIWLSLAFGLSVLAQAVWRLFAGLV